MFGYGKFHLFCLFLDERNVRMINILNRMMQLNPLDTQKNLPLPVLSCSIFHYKFAIFFAHDQ